MDIVRLHRRREKYWSVYLPASMLAWGSELRFSRRITIFAFDLGSESSASDCRAACYSPFHGSDGRSRVERYLLIIDRGCQHKACSTISKVIHTSISAMNVHAIDPRYLCR